jgi:Fe-Mn family superoxide dismutase
MSSSSEGDPKMTEVSRRTAVKTLGAGALVMTTIDSAAASQGGAAPAPAFSSNYQAKPLKFDPAKLEGLSEPW